MINRITSIFNNFKLIFYGLLFRDFCCLLTAPIGILPHSYLFILIGIILEGLLKV